MSSDSVERDIRSLLKSAKAALAEASISAVDGELLLAHILGVNRMELHAKQFNFTPEESEELADQLDSLIQLRIAGTPTQYITGEAPFRYLTLDIGAGALIPRPETELLVDEVLHNLARYQQPISIVDLGSGSGAIAISLASETLGKVDTRIVAVEISEEAATWLNRNIGKFDLPIRTVISDVKDALIDVKCDVVVANPPYIPVGTVLPSELAAEPAIALFGGSNDGMAIPQEFIAAAAHLLKSGGLFAMEHDESQADAVRVALNADFETVHLHRDLNDRPRFTTALRK